jgi:hypothetical protein
MTGNTQHIIARLFNADSLEKVTVEQLQNITEEYPSFGVAHYLLSKKLQQENSNAFLEQTKKTALFFPNPFWLQSLLQQKNTTNSEKPGLPKNPITAIENNTEENTVAQAPVEENHLEQEPVLSAQQETASAPVTEEVLVFEPYHTIDYFASQGIKLVLDENPKDRLGKQLKSFTDWLKVMKKLPPKSRETEAAEAEANDTDSAVIESEAAHSVEGKEVLTEAMAEVLLKQGKIEKAAEVYNKLSLLYPDKSVYFAAKFEHLKVH